MRRILRQILTTTILSLVAGSFAWAQNQFSQSQYKSFTAQGVPDEALTPVFSFLKANAAKTLNVTGKNRASGELEKTTVQVQSRYAVIVDYSKPSSEKRFYLLNFKQGTVQKFYVAHGHRTGVTKAVKFSNELDSHQSSLGMTLTGDTYYGFHKKSLALYGLDPSTSRVAERDIVLHGAEYASGKYMAKYGRLGRSWGCVTVDRDYLEMLVGSLTKGSVVYLYHPDLMTEAQNHPESQALDNPPADEPDTVLPGEEEDLQAKRSLLMTPDVEFVDDL